MCSSVAREVGEPNWTRQNNKHIVVLTELDLVLPSSILGRSSQLLDWRPLVQNRRARCALMNGKNLVCHMRGVACLHIPEAVIGTYCALPGTSFIAVSGRAGILWSPDRHILVALRNYNAGYSGDEKSVESPERRNCAVSRSE